MSSEVEDLATPGLIILERLEIIIRPNHQKHHSNPLESRGGFPPAPTIKITGGGGDLTD